MNLRVIDGEGSGSGRAEYANAKRFAKQLVIALFDQRTRRITINDLARLDSKLVTLGLARIQRESCNPPGFQLFYQNGSILVRVKTKGNAFGPRKDRAYMAVSLTAQHGIGWDDERAKFNGAGEIEPKSLQGQSGGKSTPFKVILGDLHEGDHAKISDDWADRTHLHFEVDYLPGGEGLPFPG